MFNPKVWFVSRIEDFKAWRRGEVRISPDGTRGRVFAKRPKKNGGMGARARGIVKVDMQITRADGTVEHRVASGKTYNIN